MGVFDRWRRPVEEPWIPPLLGSCGCEEHVEALRDHLIPSSSGAEGDGVTVGALLDAGALGAEPRLPEPSYVVIHATGQRIGPFHWAVTLTGPGRSLFDPGAPTALDDCLSVQAGVERAWRDSDQFLVGAPTLCGSGVMAAMVRALDNPRVRRT